MNVVMPPAPDAHAIGVMLLTLVALFLFSRERIPVETSSLVVITVLAVGFVLFPYESEGKKFEPTDFFLGFGNDALVTICALMMASQALARTGALTPIGRVVSRAWNLSPFIASLLVLLITAIVSAFMNNTPQVVLMIPILISVAMRSGIPPSKTLMPMTFASQIGGTGTPIGTSLNLLVIGSAASLGVPRFQMFDFIVPAAIAGGIGILYLWLIAPRLLPKRDVTLADISPRVFTARMHIKEESFAEGKTLSEVIKKTDNEMGVVRVERGSGIQIASLPDVMLRAGDKLVVKDTPERLKEFERMLGAALYSGDKPVDEEHPLTAEDQQIAELVVIRGSPLNGRTLSEVQFDERYSLLPLALHRAGYPVEKEHLNDVRLGTGDVLLVQGPSQQISEVKRQGDLLVLDATTDLPHTAKAPLALAIMAGIVALAALQILPIVFAAVCGVLLMIFTGCLRWRDAIGALDAPMIFLTAASIALSLGLVTTGAAAFIAKSFLAVSFDLQPAFMLSGLILLMAIMANIISNTAAAVIGTPIAIGIANALGAPPEPFVLAVLFGVNMGYATPMADNCNLLVYSAGGYLFKDFVRVGIPLLIIMWMAYSFLLPQFFPLKIE
jgi:di/tricarboxylate transporter